MGRRSAAHHARRELEAHGAFVAEFSELAAGLDAFLDHGDHEAFTKALDALEDPYDRAPQPVDPAAPRGERLAEHARRYAKASLARSFMLTLQRRVEDRMQQAQAQLLAVAAEPADMPQYARRLCSTIIAEGIRQEDVGHGSRALGKRIAATIRALNAGGVAQAADEPLRSWSDLPREFAGFRLVDVAPDDGRLLLPHFVCPLPPSTDIAFFTADGIAPSFTDDRRTTYEAWIPIVEAWAKRTSQALHDHQPPLWAMLLANRIDDDGSRVDFFDGRMIESPWARGAVVMIKVMEDDVPKHL